MPRNAVNEIVPGKIYQRGQILTWQREKKYRILSDLGIRYVVNFWPKLDPDLAEADIDGYFCLPAVRSEQMLEPRIEVAARWIARLCKDKPVLVLCEAGVTRSVYFCVLVTSLLLQIPLHVAKDRVVAQTGRTSLKPFMLCRIARGWEPTKKPRPIPGLVQGLRVR